MSEDMKSLLSQRGGQASDSDSGAVYLELLRKLVDIHCSDEEYQVKYVAFDNLYWEIYDKYLSGLIDDTQNSELLRHLGSFDYDISC